MGTTTLLSVEEYLKTVYRPDCDYVDGVIEERNLGEQDHARLQALMTGLLLNLERTLGIRVLTDQRVQVKPTRFRIPDLCVLLNPITEQVLQTPPFLCIEILSPEDRMERMQRRIDDYLEMGVPYVWVVSPQSRKGWVYTAERMYEVRDGVLRTENPEISVRLTDLFAGF